MFEEYQPAKDELPKETRNAMPASVGILVIGLLGLVLLSKVVGCWDDTTELTPGHPDVLSACFVMGGLGGLLAHHAAPLRVETKKFEGDIAKKL